MIYRAAPTPPIYECVWHGSEDPAVAMGDSDITLCDGSTYHLTGITNAHHRMIYQMLMGLFDAGRRQGEADLFRRIKALEGR